MEDLLATDSPDQSLEGAENAHEPRRHLVLVHGHGEKPLAGELENLWRSAIAQGIERDHGRKLASLPKVTVSFVYYGDLTRGMRRRLSETDEVMDLTDRYTALEELSARASTKAFRSGSYHRMKRRSGIGKLAMDIAAPIARGLRLDLPLIRRVSPELGHYFEDAAYATSLRARVEEVLRPALAGGDDVVVLAHCLGSVIAYDCLWEMSRGALPCDRKVRSLITLGSPLAIDAVRARLRGAQEAMDRRYPGNIANWFNLAAQDDYICHDPTVYNDFQPMIGHRMISRLEDIGIFNFAQRFGRSNPHCDLGYLIHPHTARLLADWLRR